MQFNRRVLLYQGNVLEETVVGAGKCKWITTIVVIYILTIFMNLFLSDNFDTFGGDGGGGG